MRARPGVASLLLGVIFIALLAAAAIWSREGMPATAHLAFIIGFASVAAVGLLLPLPTHKPSEAEQATTQPASVDDLVGMLGDALVLSRDARAGQPFERVDVLAVLSNVLARHPYLSPMRNPEPRALYALTSIAALERALAILIDVARANGDNVAVSWDAGASAVAVHVDDDGPGIARDLRERVFEWQYYMTTPPSQRVACRAEFVFARQIARNSGGDVIAGPSPLGGARLTLRLPLSTGPSEVAETATTEVAASR